MAEQLYRQQLDVHDAVYAAITLDPEAQSAEFGAAMDSAVLSRIGNEEVADSVLEKIATIEDVSEAGVRRLTHHLVSAFLDATNDPSPEASRVRGGIAYVAKNLNKQFPDMDVPGYVRELGRHVANPNARMALMVIGSAVAERDDFRLAPLPDDPRLFDRRNPNPLRPKDTGHNGIRRVVATAVVASLLAAPAAQAAASQAGESPANGGQNRAASVSVSANKLAPSDSKPAKPARTGFGGKPLGDVFKKNTAPAEEQMVKKQRSASRPANRQEIEQAEELFNPPKTGEPISVRLTPEPKPVEALKTPEKAAPRTSLSPETIKIIESKNLKDFQKEFLETSVLATMQLVDSGEIENVNPEVLIAQSILESAWGDSSLSKKHHNYFGHKAGTSWKGETVTYDTKEQTKSGSVYYEKAKFRSYPDAKAGFKGHVSFLKMDHYKDALQYSNNPQRFVEEVKEGGYATDVEYVSKIMGTIKANQISRIIEIERANAPKPPEPEPVPTVASVRSEAVPLTKHEDVVDIFGVPEFGGESAQAPEDEMITDDVFGAAPDEVEVQLQPSAKPSEDAPTPEPIPIPEASAPAAPTRTLKDEDDKGKRDPFGWVRGKKKIDTDTDTVAPPIAADIAAADDLFGAPETPAPEESLADQVFGGEEAAPTETPEPAPETPVPAPEASAPAPAPEAPASAPAPEPEKPKEEAPQAEAPKTFEVNGISVDLIDNRYIEEGGKINSKGLGTPLKQATYVEYGVSPNGTYDGYVNTPGTHTGVDFPVPTGTPALAIAPSEIVSVSPGTIVARITHGPLKGMYWNMQHLNVTGVEVGQQVKLGEQVATTGARNTNGAHLHFTLAEAHTKGRVVSRLDGKAEVYRDTDDPFEHMLSTSEAASAGVPTAKQKLGDQGYYTKAA